MIRQVPLLGYPSQLGAITALMGEGLGKRQIMDRTGLDGDRVSSLMAHARRAAAARAAGPEWTVERVERAMRIHAAGMAVMAEAFGVSVAEFAEVVTHRIGDGVPEAVGEARARGGRDSVPEAVGEARARGEKSTEDDDGTDDAQRAAGSDDGGGGADAARGDNAGGISPAVVTSGFGPQAAPEAAEGGADAVAVLEAGSPPPSSQPDGAAEPPGEPAAEPPVAVRFVNGQGFVAAEPADVDAEREALAAAFSSAQRFSLRATDGQSLHQHTRGLTRLSSFFWLGTAEQVAKLKRQQPEWAQLQPKAWK